ncbi:hypothetical protein [Nocardia flavorosea]|uniref:Uncharacterized protein n=1 Tax=Nocardia flavorosea TaxID=53429 RepID=A0A846YTE3_9NOCA|nr:hypothetical protein [Nocardia flavorosea]NKY60931.1 hypothetical protein [Nocardia flavorosea]
MSKNNRSGGRARGTRRAEQKPSSSPTWQEVVLALGALGMSFAFIGFLVAGGMIRLSDAAWVAGAVLVLIFVLVFRGSVLRRGRAVLMALFGPQGPA